MRALVIMPHPDDETQFGGLLARLTEEGNTIEALYLTMGELGSSDARIRGQQLAQIRKREMQLAAEVLGIRIVGCLGLPDMGVKFSDEVVNKIVDIIQKRKPDVVLAPEPFVSTYNHPDHLTTGKIVYWAWKRLGRKKGLYFFDTRAPNLWVDVSRWMYRAIASATKHRSQILGIFLSLIITYLFYMVWRLCRISVPLRNPVRSSRVIFPLFLKVDVDKLRARRKN
ncbi:MAG: PIG-L family deacetylase [Candidatus Korarchaeota archaeon]